MESWKRKCGCFPAARELLCICAFTLMCQRQPSGFAASWKDRRLHKLDISPLFQMVFRFSFFFFLYLLIMPLVCFSLSIFPSVFYCRVQNANVHHVELMRDFRPLEWLHKRVNSHFFIPAKKQTWPEWVCMTKEHREGKHGVSWHALPIHIQYRKRYHLFTRWKLSTTGLCFQAVNILLLGS